MAATVCDLICVIANLGRQRGLPRAGWNMVALSTQSTIVCGARHEQRLRRDRS